MATLSSCKRELASIIRELQSIEDGIRYDFIGIGQEKCADCVGRVVEKYQSVQRRLNQVNMNRLAEWALGDKS